MRIVVSGGAGRLGSLLGQLLTAAGHEVRSFSSDQLDITDFETARRTVRDAAPDLVINAAAWTDVDGCARDPEKAIRINGYGAQHLALAAADTGAAVLYVSSNEVFDGTSQRPYYEYDAPRPINAYGYSKWVGEQTTRLNPKHYIVRTAWLFAHGGKNFIQAMLGAAQAGKALRVVANEVANPTYTDDLAAAIVQLATTGRYGVYHVVNEGACSRWTFARYALDRAGYADAPLGRISSHEWKRASTPPPYAALHNVAGPMVGVTLRPWQDAVDAFLEREGLLTTEGRA